VGEEGGIAVGQAELCHIRPHTSKSAAAKWLREETGKSEGEVSKLLSLLMLGPFVQKIDRET